MLAIAHSTTHRNESPREATQPRPAPRPVRSRAIVLAHFDPGGDFDPHVLHAIRMYRQVADRLVVVSAGGHRLPAAAARLVDTFIPRPNVGYDFGSWRQGIAALPPDAFDEIICVNDSVYGPVFDLAPALTDPRVAHADLWGMVLSEQPPRPDGPPRRRHLQSWFFAMRRPLIESAAFERFWAAVVPVASKQQVIERYEVGMTEHFRQAGFSVAALYDAGAAPLVTLAEVWPQLSLREVRRSWRLWKKSRRTPHNPSELVWWRLLEAGVPYVKVGLFRVNHYGIGLEGVWRGLAARTSYDTGLIRSHLARCA